MCHIRLRVHLNPPPLHILSSLPSSLPMPNPEAKSNPSKRLPSASLATLLIHREGLSIRVHSVSRFFAAFKSIRSIPYLLNDCSFSLPLGCARLDATFHAAILLQARRNLITQKNENLKSADNISTHACDGTRKVAPVKSSTWSRGSDLKFSFKFEENVTEYGFQNPTDSCSFPRVFCIND